MFELHTLSALEIGKRVNAGELQPTEVVKYFLDRIKKLNPALNAFVYVKEQEALEAAKNLEFRLKAGDYVGPFAGVPFALKDFLPSKKGWTNTHGGVKCLEAQDAFDSEFCKAMEAAGGIAIGKTNAPAFGFRGTTDNKLYGPTHNPHNLNYNSGGSSGGSAAAVAAGLVPIAEGGDAGGSIRIPAAWCGCYGFKSTYGLIPSVCRPDAWAASHPFCTPGGLTKTVEDAEVLLSLMCRFDPRDPHSVITPNWSWNHIGDGVKYLKVAATVDFGIFEDVDPEIQQAVRDVAKKLEDGGATVDWIPNIISKPYNPDYLAGIWCRHISVDSMLEFEEKKKVSGFEFVREDLPSEFVMWYTRAMHLSVQDFYEFNKVRTDIYDDFLNVFKDYDIILSPVTTCLPVKNSNIKGETKGPEGPKGHESLIGFTETFLYNLTGNPAASCPAGFSKEGLPIGVQIAGNRFMDPLVLSVSKFLQKNK